MVIKKRKVPKVSVRKETVFTGAGKERLFAVRINAGSSIAEFKKKKDADKLARRLRIRI